MQTTRGWPDALGTEKTVNAELVSLSGLVPSGMRLLASCFDAHHTIGGGLFAIDAEIDEIDRVSSSGLCTADGLLFRCLWSADGSPAELVVYDSVGVRRYHRLDGVSTPHDILVVDGTTLVVATMQNELQRVGPDGSIVSRWRAPGEADSWHLNSLARYGDRIVVCGFGQFLRRRGWDATGRPASGRVMDPDNGEVLLQGLHAPHNPWYANGIWLICDSASGELLEIPDATRQVSRRLPLPGWPRGLVVTDQHLFIGLSPHRHAASSVETAAVAVVDRARWQTIGLMKLPAREVYALALAPVELVEGARQGFGANHTRTHEQEQRHLFDQLGVRPRRLWAIGDPLSSEECRAVLTVDQPMAKTVAAGSLLTVTCAVRNAGPGLLTPAPPYPVRVTHRWYDDHGEVVDTQPITSSLPRSLPPEAETQVPVRSRVPSAPGRYRLRITLEQEGGVPFDELDESSAVDLSVDAVADAANYAALGEFGLYPAEIRAACLSSASVEDMVRALLARPSGEPNGLTLALIEDKGREAFVSAVAATLGGTAAAIQHLVNEVLPKPADILLTGAEAVALALYRSGAGVAFAYAGTSELALCDALARMGLLVNGRGDRESLFQAAGASRLRPGNGAAVLHGARGLTNALGALADVRRNEIGTVAVVGMPSTGSAPFLPPHGEPNLLSDAGAFAKSWYELGAVPADPQGRRAAVDHLVTALRKSFDDALRPPYGPVLLGIPQDVAEKAWVPLAALSEPQHLEPPRLDSEAVRSAAALLASARRPLVLIDDYMLVYDEIRPTLASFCDRIAAPVLQVKYRRGPMLFERLNDIDVPTFAGWYDPADPAHQALLSATDLLITIEDRNMYPRVVGELPSCRKIALTSKPLAVRKNGYHAPEDVLVDGDVGAALKALTETATATAQRWYDDPRSERGGLPVPEAAATIRRSIAQTIAKTAAGLAKQPILLDDSQMFGGMLAEEYDVFPTGLRVFGGHGGFVGSGITLAAGLALGEPSAKVFCCLGDQGFTNSMQGLVAAVQESAPVTFLVCNNGGAVSLRKQSRPSGWLDNGGDSFLDNAVGMHYTDVASAFGVRSRRVDLSNWLDHDAATTGCEAFDEAMGAMMGHSGPTLIELVLPADPEFWTGVWSTEGFEQTAAVGAAHA
jgi:acetolactate synthase-1/2/3 large subunit